MAHRSDSNYSLDITLRDRRDFERINDTGKTGCVYVFHLQDIPVPSATLDGGAFNTYFDSFLSVLPDNTIVAFISDSKSALEVTAQLRNRLEYRLWIAVAREQALPRNGQLPDNHVALTVFSKSAKRFNHSRIQIEYTVCPSCGKTTKDYGGKKHLYSPYGTLMADVWRDVKMPNRNVPEEVLKRLADLFAVAPFSELRYFDLRRKCKLYSSPQISARKYRVSNDRIESCLFNGDCIQMLRQLPESSVDFIFADPPYNIKKKYDNWDDGIEIEEYFRWCDAWMEELHRVLKPGRVFCIINIPHWIVRHYLFAKNLFHYVDYIAWEGLSLPVRNIMPAHYGILCLSKGEFEGISNYDAELNHESVANSTQSLKEWYCVRQSCVKGRNSFAITDREPVTNLWWDIHRLKHNSKRVDHPCQLPPDLMRRLIYTFSKPGDLVLDPFNGAGTTTLVAELMKRRYVGIELSEKYHEIAQTRHLEIANGINPFRKFSQTPTSKNSRVQRLTKQTYRVSKKVLQLEVKDIAESLGRKPTRKDVQKLSKFPFEYFESYFIDWGEVCAAVGDKGMSENLGFPRKEKYEQLALLEKPGTYRTKD